MAFELVTMRIDSIIIDGRFRKEAGDISSLAKSIQDLGQLQPIGVTPDNRLVFGERRIRALMYLGQSTVVARVVNLSTPLQAEFDENECRLEFTPSERLAIRDAIARDLGNRQGRRADTELVCHGAQVTPGTKTRDIAAETAGFSSNRQFERVKQVVELGMPELVEAMDKKEVSISAAASIAILPHDEQKALLKAGTKAVKQAAKRMRKEISSSVDPDEFIKLKLENAALQTAKTDVLTIFDEVNAKLAQAERENKRLSQIFNADDQLAAALNEIKEQKKQIEYLETVRDELMNERNELIRLCRSQKSMLKKLGKTGRPETYNLA